MTVTHWPSTKALSVYNALIANKTNAMPATQLLAFLQRNHLPRYEAEDVAEGIDFLKGLGLVDDDPEVVAAVHRRGAGKPVPLKRINNDESLELDP